MMKQTATSNKGRLLTRVGALTPVGLAALLFVWAGVTGMSYPHLLTALLSVILTQLLPGMLVWRLVRNPERGWWAEDIGLGFGIGSGLAMLAQVPAGLLGWSWLSAAVMLTVAALILAVPRSRDRVLTARVLPLPWWWGPALAVSFLLSVVQLRSFFRLSPLEWGSGARALQIDTYLHMALAGELAHRGPVKFPWVQSEDLGYHWMAHSWIAQVSVTSGSGIDEVLLRFMPVLMVIVVPLAVAGVALRLTGAAWAGPVAAFLAMGTGAMNVLGALTDHAPTSPISPTLAPSIPIMLAAIALLHQRWRRTAGWGSAPLLLVLAFTAAGTKGSSTPLLVAGLGLAGVAMIVQRRWRLVWQLLWDGALVLAGLVIAMTVVFRESDAGLKLDPAGAAGQSWASAFFGTSSVHARLADSGVVVFGALTPSLIGLVLLFHQRWRQRPLAWTLLGASLAGAIPLALFSHPGRSQGYFALNAIPILALAATCGLVVMRRQWPARQLARALAVGLAGGLVATAGPAMLLAEPGSTTRSWLMLALGAGCLAAVALACATLAPGRRWEAAVAGVGIAVLAGGLNIKWESLQRPAPHAARSIGARAPLAATHGQIDAARWIRDHSGRKDLVMTNRHCIIPVSGVNGCDSRRWLVAAYTERQVLLEGWTATPRSAAEGPNGRDSITVPYWHPQLQALNDGFIEHPTAQAAEELERRHVRWIFVDHTRPHAKTLEPFATLRHRFPGVDVYEFPR